MEKASPIKFFAGIPSFFAASVKAIVFHQPAEPILFPSIPFSNATPIVSAPAPKASEILVESPYPDDEPIIKTFFGPVYLSCDLI